MPESLHPAARILVWIAWAAGVEFASLPVLQLLAVVCATAFVFADFRRYALRLMRRTRWLMGVLLLTYAYTLPGSALWPALGWLSPSIEGTQAGAERLLRLVLILLALALLLVRTERSRLVYGLYVLTRPFAWLGFDRRAFAVRLGLTLEYVEAPCALPWLQRLREPLPVPDGPNVFQLASERWRVIDGLALLGALACLLLLLA